MMKTTKTMKTTTKTTKTKKKMNTTLLPIRPRSPEHSHQREDGLQFDEFRFTSDSDSVHYPPLIHSRVPRGSSCHTGSVSPANHTNLRPHQGEDGCDSMSFGWHQAAIVFTPPLPRFTVMCQRGLAVTLVMYLPPIIWIYAYFRRTM